MDIPSCLRTLDLSSEGDLPDLAWLEESYCDPDRFWAALAAHAREIGPAPRSRRGHWHDLYYDAVGRHAASGRAALVTFDRRAGFRALSYAELDGRASACAAAWAAQGIVPGAVLALVLPFGPKWLVAFAAALRLGLCVSPLAPAGEAWLLPRLKALKPLHVVFDPVRPPPLGPFADLALEVVIDGPPHAEPPHAYAPAEPCGRIFSPLRAPLLVPVDLPAERAHGDALRDALFAYRLAPGDTVALPGFHPQQHQPAVLLAALLAGATTLHIAIEDIEADPAILKKQPVHVLGVAPALCELLRRRPAGPLPALRHWFRSVDEPLDWIAWNDFVTKNDWKRVPASNVLVDAASGGCVLFSTRRPGSVHALALPAPGRPFMLLDSTGSGEPAVGGAGVFVPQPSKEPEKDGWFVLARRGTEYLYGLSVLPRRAGRIFPSAEAEAIVAQLPSVIGAGTVPVATGDPGGRWAFVLVVFTGARRPPAALAAQIEERLRCAPSGDMVPDRIEIVPLYPRAKGEKVDAGWCRGQYSAGLLKRKAEHPLFQRLTALRAALLEA